MLGAARRAARTAAPIEAAGRGDVVFLDQHHVVQADAVIAAAAAAHRVLLRASAAPEWSCGYPGSGSAVPATACHVAVRDARGAGQQLQKIERRALAGQDARARPVSSHRMDWPGRCAPSSNAPADPHAGIELPEGLLEPGRAAQYRRLAAQHLRMSPLSGRDQPSGDVARPDVFAQRARHLLGQVRRQRDRYSTAAGGGSSRPCTAAAESTARSWCARPSPLLCAPAPSPRSVAGTIPRIFF